LQATFDQNIKSLIFSGVKIFLVIFLYNSVWQVRKEKQTIVVTVWLFFDSTYKKLPLRGTMSQDFWPSVFFVNRSPLGPWLIPYNIFEICFEFTELFAL
jgi:hypothetical protein